MNIPELKKRNEELCGPFGFTGLSVTLDSISDYTNFCNYYFPKLISRIELLERINKAAASVLTEEGVADSISCYVMGVELIDAVSVARKAE